MEDLEERKKTGVVMEQVYNSSGQVALSKQEEMQFQAETVHTGAQQSDRPTVTGANPFSKKRKLEEITQQESRRDESNGVDRAEHANGAELAKSAEPAASGSAPHEPSDTKMQVDEVN